MTILNFEIDGNPESSDEVEAIVDRCLKEFQEIEESAQYALVLHNDPINGVDFVTSAIMKTFSYSLSRSVYLMLKAHFTGNSILWIGTLQKATEKSNQLKLLGPDPNTVKKGAKPITVTVERQF